MPNDLDELERQMAMLEDIPTSEVVSTPVQNTVPQAQPIIANVTAQPIVNTIEPQAVMQNTVPMPQTPENPTNTGIVTNSVAQTIQAQVNNQVAAQVVQPSVTSFTQPIAQAPIANPQAQQNLDIFDNEEAPVFVNISEAVDENKMPFVELKPGEATRIMLFTQRTIQVYTHYIEGLGYIRCLSKRDATGRVNMKAPCCEFKDEEGKDKYATCREILPVIEYPVGKDGKSLLANKNPELKFMLITKADRKSLNAIMGDEERTAQAMSMDFSVTIDASDRFKTKVFSSTFNTIRNQYADAINAEIAKFNDDMLLKARDERYRKVPVQAIQAELEKSRASETLVNQMMNQQIPTLGI